MEKTVLSTDELKHKAETYCAMAEHCPTEVQQKLYQWGSQEQQTTAIIRHLIANDYINTGRYCRAYTHDKIAYQGWGRIKIKMMLQSKHLSEEDIDSALQEVDENEYRQMLVRVAQQKKGATWEQVARFLIQRGFEYDIIRTLIKP